jgi:hypothetical protein
LKKKDRKTIEEKTIKKGKERETRGKKGEAKQQKKREKE